MQFYNYFYLVAALCLISFQSFAQITGNFGDDYRIKNIDFDKIYFMADNFKVYEELFDEVWTFSKYEFVSVEEWFSLAKNSSNQEPKLFLFLFDEDDDYKRKWSPRLSVEVMHGVGMGGIPSFTKRVAVTFMMEHFEGSEQLNEALLGLYLKNLQQTLKAIQSHEEYKNHVSLYLMKNHYHPAQIENMTLIINENLLSDKLSREELKGAYPYPYKIVSNDELIALAEEENTDHAFLIAGDYPQGAKLATISVIQSRTGKCLYFDALKTKVKLPILSSDRIGRLADKIKKDADQ